MTEDEQVFETWRRNLAAEQAADSVGMAEVMIDRDDRDVPFTRTVCACAADVRNCHEQPGYLGVGDMARIYRTLPFPSLAEPPSTSLFRRGRAVLASSRTGQTLEVATIVPARQPDGRCVFLGADDLCRVHEVAPYGCAYFDVHQSRDEWQRRSLYMLRLIAGNQDYQETVARLQPKEA